jgi:hypothetical protein
MCVADVILGYGTIRDLETDSCQPNPIYPYNFLEADLNNLVFLAHYVLLHTQHAQTL